MKPAGKVKRKNDFLKEERTFFEIPRKSSGEIIPELIRLKEEKKRIQQHRLHMIKDMFLKNRTKNIKKHLKHIVELDKSDAIIPHGEVSKRLYETIFNDREFDLYGRLVIGNHKNLRKQEELQKMAKYLGLKYDKEIVPEESVNVPKLFGNTTDDLAAPSLRTAKHDIGYMPEPFAPIGAARNPASISRSYGNDLFFSYNGNWSDGKMNGFGTYKFIDSMIYKGTMKDNHMSGEGTSTWPTSLKRPTFYDERFEDEQKIQAKKTKELYDELNKPSDEAEENRKKALTEEELKKEEEEKAHKKKLEEDEELYTMHEWFDDSSYEGTWKNSRWDGMGLLKTASGSEYKGSFYMGRRHGNGKLKYASGLVYDGEWLDGRPHGRGKMWSELHGYTFDGQFHMGSIQDSGVLTTPLGERIINYWPAREGQQVLLPTLIKNYLRDQEAYKKSLQRKKDGRYAGLRGEQLHLYVEAIRKRNHTDKMRAKKERFNENLRKLKEQKERLHEARLKALGA